jgi:7-carboxy-7-deazaguanine synthase
LFSELTPLCQRLRTAGRHITIETAGTLHLPVQCDLMSISPKTANSAPDRAEQPRWRARHEQTRWAPLVLQRLMSEHDHQLKFVVDTPDDCDEIEQLVEQLNAARQRVYLMPQGVTPEQLADRGDWLEAECRRRGLRFCPRRQIEWFGLTRGT